MSDLSEAGGRETLEQIRTAGGTAEFIRADVSNSADVEHLVQSAAALYGRIDYACNTAGIAIETERLAECDDETFDKVIAVNLRGTFLCLKHQIRQMLVQKTGGSIVNFSSVAAFRTKGLYQSAYVASKAGLIALSRIAAMTYAPDGIRINTIVPGSIDTPMLREGLAKMGISKEMHGASFGFLGRIGQPEEIADAVLWLCSECASFVVGCVLPVDGGALIGDRQGAVYQVNAEFRPSTPG